MAYDLGFDVAHHRIDDPDPALAVYLDRSLPLCDEAKASLLRGQKSWSHRYLRPVIIPFIRGFLLIAILLRSVLPARLKAVRFLHELIYWGLRVFATRDACLLILRHFHLGSQILGFIGDNAKGVEIKSVKPLRPTCLEDLRGDTFLIHDLNLFNFVIELNDQLRSRDAILHPPGRINYSAILEGPPDINLKADRWHNVIDLETAIEIYTPLYAFFLSDRDFERAAHSLQLDETIAAYVAQILGDPTPVAVVSNRHPTLPESRLSAARRLMHHGLDAESLHGHLLKLKRQYGEMSQTRLVAMN